MKTARNGFTLLEMSMVLVIIGLIVGAVFSGVALVRASHIQSMIGEYDTYVKAVKEFQDKFLALPGDMNNAESMWGTDPGGCPNTASNSISKVATCNGNGDGSIGSSDTSGTLSNSREWFRAWQQLSDAGFISQQFSGTPGVGGVQEAVPKQNIPISIVPGAGWTLLFYLQSVDGNLWGDTQYGHLLLLGGFSAASYASAPVFSASEALAIDQKIDDGNPGLGKVRAWRRTVLPNCTTNDTSQAGQAYVSSGGNALVCSMVFLLGL